MANIPFSVYTGKTSANFNWSRHFVVSSMQKSYETVLIPTHITYLMSGYAPELDAFVQWISVDAPNYSPTSTTPSSVVANLTNKTIKFVY